MSEKVKNKTSCSKKLLIYAFLVVFVVSIFSTAVSAGGGFNSSRSNWAAISKLEELGVDKVGIKKILDAFDDEIVAYARYRDAMANTIQTMKEVGMNGGDINRVLFEIGLSSKREGTEVWGVPAKRVRDDDSDTQTKDGICWCNYKGHYIEFECGKGPISGGCTEAETGVAPSDDGVKDDVAIKKILAGYGIDEEGITRILDSLEDLAQAANDYEIARLNTLAVIKEAGIDDDAKIEEVLDVLGQNNIIVKSMKAGALKFAPGLLSKVVKFRAGNDLANTVR